MFLGLKEHNNIKYDKLWFYCSLKYVCSRYTLQFLLPPYNEQKKLDIVCYTCNMCYKRYILFIKIM